MVFHNFHNRINIYQEARAKQRDNKRPELPATIASYFADHLYHRGRDDAAVDQSRPDVRNDGGIDYFWAAIHHRIDADYRARAVFDFFPRYL